MDQSGPNIVLEAEQIEFRWTAEPEADRYEVDLFIAGRPAPVSLTVRPPAQGTTWSVPGDLSRPVAVLWKVRALRAGRLVAESRTIAFELQ